MSFDAGTRVKLGVLILILYSVVSVGLLVKRQLRLRNKAHAASARTLQLRALRHRLPARGTLGYVTDRGTPPEPTALTRESIGKLLEVTDAQYFLTQYELAPLILVPLSEGLAPPYLADFKDPAQGTRRLEAKGLVVRDDLGDGLWLLDGPGR